MLVSIASCRIYNSLSSDSCICINVCFQGKKAFKIDFDKAIVELSDRDNASIPRNKFPFVIDKLATCSYFCINLKMMDTSEAIITPNVSFLHAFQLQRALKSASN